MFPTPRKSNLPESGLVKILNKLGRTRHSPTKPTSKSTNPTLVPTPTDITLPPPALPLELPKPTGPRSKSARTFPQQQTVPAPFPPQTVLAPFPQYTGSVPLFAVTANSLLPTMGDAPSSSDIGGLASPPYSDGYVPPQPIIPPAEIMQMFRREMSSIQNDMDKFTNFSSKEKQELADYFGLVADKFEILFQPCQVAFDNHVRISMAEAHLRRQLNFAMVELANLNKDNQMFAQRIQHMEEQFKRENTALLQKIQAQEQQLKGKRALWLDQNPGHDVRREAMEAIVADPFGTPRGVRLHEKSAWASGGSARRLHQSSSVPKGRSFSARSTSKMGELTAVEEDKLLKSVDALAVGGSETPTHRSRRRRGVLPSGNPSLNPPPGPSKKDVMASLATLPKDTAPGSPEKFRYRAIKRDLPPAVAADTVSGKWECAPLYAEHFRAIFTNVETWCKAYTALPNLENEQRIQKRNPLLWDFMMNCAYPHSRPDSKVHVSTLLQNSRSRHAFCQRMMATYFTTAILILEEFDDFSPEAATTLGACREALNERGLASEVRRDIVLRFSKQIETIAEHPGFAAYQAARITHHTTKLRSIMGPLLNDHANRHAAGTDIGTIVKMVWNASVKMHSAYLTFQIFFPETNTKFVQATMFARDQVDDQSELQFNQLRVKLSITPTITVRDDSTTSIRTQNLLKATVLTMA